MTNRELDVFIRWVLGGLIVLAVIYFFPWGDITWGKILHGAEGQVTVTGYAESNEKNEVAMFSAGVSAISDEKEVAVGEVNAKMTELIKTVKGLGIEEEDIKTQQMSVYQMQENVEPDLVGRGRVKLGQWTASNTVEITLREIEKTGMLADILNGSGANNVYGPNFQLDSSVKASDELLSEAVQDAREKAERMAEASGAKLGRVVSITEGGASAPIAYPMLAMERSSMVDMKAPAEVGTTRVSKYVTVVFVLR